MVVIAPKGVQADAALMYVRAVRSRAAGSDDSRDRGRRPPPPSGYPFEEIYPVDPGSGAARAHDPRLFAAARPRTT